MKILALTGGIASGKSTVCRYLRECGATVLNADRLAHQVYRPGTQAFRALLGRYGKRILRRDGGINRNSLAKIIFHSKKQKKWVERLVHPATLRLIQDKLQKAMRRNPPLIVVEAALHVETGYYRKFQGLIVVDLRREIQLKRLMEREGLTGQEAVIRIKNQIPLKKKRALADWVLDNSGTKTQTKRQVRVLYQKLIKDGKKPKGKN